MREGHITDLLERGPVAGLNADEKARVADHSRECVACRRAYDAALVADAMIGARAAATVEPPPFFEKRVMAALRAAEAAPEPSGLAALWRATSALVSAMAATVVLLAGFTYVDWSRATQPHHATPPEARALYSSEYDALEEDGPAQARLSDDQLIAVVYDSEDVYGQGR